MASKKIITLENLRTFKDLITELIPTVSDEYSPTSSDAMSGKAVASAIKDVDCKVKTVNNVEPDSSGNVTISIPDFSSKQDNISDLEAIRAGAALGATALQSYTEKYTGTYNKPSDGIPKTDLESTVQTSLGLADSAIQTEADPVFSASAAAGIKDTDIANWNSKTSNVGTVTSVNNVAPVNGNVTISIPTVNNATLTIQKNGTEVATFTANASSNATANITVPTKISDLTNDSGLTSNIGTITGITMNGSSKGTSGVVDLGTVITDISGKADLASPTFTGTPSAPTAASGDNTTQIATTAFVQSAIDTKLATNDAMIFKGTIGTGGTVTALPATHNAGWTYKVITSGKYANIQCEVGDMIICMTDGTAANDAHWTVVQTNIDGAVTGPASSTADHIATFSGTTGKVVKDSGYTIAPRVPANAKFTDTVYTHPTATAYTSGLYKVTVDGTGHVTSATAVVKKDITDLGIPASDTNTVTTATDSGTGDVVTGVSATNGALTITKGNQTWANISDKPTSFTPSSHNQASSTINAMTSYSKASSVSAIATTDTLNQAIGKLEKALDGKANLSGATFTGNVAVGSTTINATNGHIITATGLEIY